MLTKEIFL